MTMDYQPDPADNTVHICMERPNFGVNKYMAIGFPPIPSIPDGKMKDVDIVVGKVDKHGKGTTDILYSNQSMAPPTGTPTLKVSDAKMEYDKKTNKARLCFKRPIKGDGAGHNNIDSDDASLLWSNGNLTDKGGLSYHGPSTGKVGSCDDEENRCTVKGIRWLHTPPPPPASSAPPPKQSWASEYWWVILIICLLVLALLIILAYFLYNYHKRQKYAQINNP
eukprot:334450_1